jgi:hypothetical protein
MYARWAHMQSLCGACCLRVSLSVGHLRCDASSYTGKPSGQTNLGQGHPWMQQPLLEASSQAVSIMLHVQIQGQRKKLQSAGGDSCGTEGQGGGTEGSSLEGVTLIGPSPPSSSWIRHPSCVPATEYWRTTYQLPFELGLVIVRDSDLSEMTGSCLWL